MTQMRTGLVSAAYVDLCLGRLDTLEGEAMEELTFMVKSAPEGSALQQILTRHHQRFSQPSQGCLTEGLSKLLP